MNASPVSVVSHTSLRTKPSLLSLALFVATVLVPRGSDLPAAEPHRPVDQAWGDRGMVVSQTDAASRIGRDVLAQRGNAVDAAIATAFALAVTWPEAGNIGGGGFMMIHPGDGRAPVCVDYRETAPAAATVTMFSPHDGRHTHQIVGVPGTVRGLELAHEWYGSLPWKQLVMPAVKLAAEGFPVDEWLARSTNGVLSHPLVRTDPKFAELRRVYGNPTGEPWEPGDHMLLPDLGWSLRLIAEQGADAFYTGPIADRLVAEMQRSADGLITKDDLAEYQAKIHRPIHGTYRGYDVYGPPPPSSGGICVVQALNILETFNLRAQPRFGARTLHLMAEAMRRAFCDRARHLGDADFVTIPGHLTDKAYARKLAAEIKLAAATPSAALAPDIPLADESPSTTHLSVIDAAGLAVANTYTLEHSWGARIVVQGAGFLLNNEMGDFNWVSGHTDRSGRIGTPPNQIAPGKRMLSSQSPTIVARDGRVLLVTGSPGGRTIINTVVCNVLNMLEFEMPLPEAINAPRLHHQWFPDVLSFEGASAARFADAVARLRAMGHTVSLRSRQGSAHSLWVDPETGRFLGVADPRRGGRAAGYTHHE